MSLTRRVFLQRIAQIGGYSAAFATMQALGLMPAVGQSPIPTLAADFGKGKKVIILGGGIAGMTAAYELRKAGFDCTILEARNRPGGRNWTVRDGTKVEFTDGTIQNCEWQDGGYLNAGPARIPSIHTHILGYCQELGVRLEVEVNSSRSALMQSPKLNHGDPVQQRQVVHDTRGYLAELLSKAINKHTLDDELSKEETARLLEFLRNFGDLNKEGRYTGTPRAGFITGPGAGPVNSVLHKPLNFSELLAADMTTGEFYEEQIDWQATMFQPVGGMDRIAYGFAKSLGDMIHYECPVTEITTSAQSVTVAYTKSGTTQTITADFCICTLPLPILAKTKNNFSPEAQQAFTGMPMVPLYKIAWESPRFWEKENNIYGGISFLKDKVDLVWYPTDKLFSPTGVLVAGFNSEQKIVGGVGGTTTGELSAFGALPTIEAKFEASRQAVELLHPGRSHLLTKPIYVAWAKIPYSLGCLANNFVASSDPAYKQLEKPEGKTYFAGDYLSHLVAWQEGAVLSAHHAIERIAKQVKS
ncbi:FAD-dependent oxidoreductase [Granulicella sp. S190]|uniref:flavin monoamine oxidase family protein n=1 Tax=Granulicella sp. S190 TaxID=1747226 RepID=UPI00131BE48F|nr:FAD-dependent oxidoreductase [Granulicella sp. S190]